jgi:drug/metabolite transporter (DMT)-like permease
MPRTATRLPGPTAAAGTQTLVGVFWMIVTGFCFVAVTASVKMVGDDVPAAQAAFLRYALGAIFLLPMIPAVRAVRFTPRILKLAGFVAWRHALGVICWFYAMTRIPIAEVTAMNYLNPIYVTVLAVLVLGERISVHRALAILFALAGAMVILRPGFRELDPGHVAMLFTAGFFAVGYLVTKILADEVPAAVVVFMLSVIGAGRSGAGGADSLGAGGLGGSRLALRDGGLRDGGHFTMTLAFRAAPLTVTQPVTFLQLVWATTLGALVFAEPVDMFVILGAG